MATTGEEATRAPMATTAEEARRAPMATTGEEATLAPMATTGEEVTRAPMDTTEEATRAPMAITGEKATRTIVILWKIESANLMDDTDGPTVIESHIIGPMALQVKKLRMILYPKGVSGKEDDIDLSIVLLDPTLDHPIDCEVSLIDRTGYPLETRRFHNYYLTDAKPILFPKFKPFKDVFSSGKSKYLTKGALAVRCIIERCGNTNLKFNEFIAVVTFLEKDVFKYSIPLEELSRFENNRKTIVPVEFRLSKGINKFDFMIALEGDSFEEAKTMIDLVIVIICEELQIALQFFISDKEKGRLKGADIKFPTLDSTNTNLRLYPTSMDRRTLKSYITVPQHSRFTLDCEYTVSPTKFTTCSAGQYCGDVVNFADLIDDFLSKNIPLLMQD